MPTRVTAAVVRYISMLDILQNKRVNGLIFLIPLLCPVTKSALYRACSVALQTTTRHGRGIPSTLLWGGVVYILTTGKHITDIYSLTNFLKDEDGIKEGDSMRNVATRMFTQMKSLVHFEALCTKSAPISDYYMEHLKENVRLYFGEM
jgi:hypothetical protein